MGASTEPSADQSTGKANHSDADETLAESDTSPDLGREVRLEANTAPGTAEATINTRSNRPRAVIGLQSSGPVPEGARADLVDQVMERDELEPYDQVHVVMPLGDSESLEQLHRHTTNLTARAAGSSSSIDADLVDGTD